MTSNSAIKKAFRQVALRNHTEKFAPGRTMDTAEFRQIREAVNVLIDQVSQARYDLIYAGVQPERRKYHATCLAWGQEHREYERGGKE